MKALGDAFSVKDGSDSENSSSGTDSEPDFEGLSEEDVLQTRTQAKEDKGKLLFQTIKDFSLDTSPEILTEWLEMNEDCLTSEFLSKEEILTGCEATSDCESDGEDVIEKVKIFAHRSPLCCRNCCKIYGGAKCGKYRNYSSVANDRLHKKENECEPERAENNGGFF
ncbi:hypothetical protein UY3_14227 [Chelonia mydas]|uniref:Uncharacterized protein n=1 Tax=Chelonia mydas TaxID=8469 RepID=M7B929_CHEMY|nr:hypothetical protein UY3_14227 [Chelonia mydas]